MLIAKYGKQAQNNTMKNVQIGKTTLEIAPLIFGGNVFGWTVDKHKSFELLDKFADLGFNCIDTADMYSTWVPGNQGGESESIIGEWMKERKNRSKFIIATKVGMEMGPDKKGLSKKYIEEAVEKSLRRLKTDYIDLYQSHRPDTETPIEETLMAYDKLITAGKIRYIGASNYTREQLKEALEVSDQNPLPAYQTLQPCYNLYDREDFETNLAPLTTYREMGVIPYYSLASGFLTGKYRSLEDTKNKARGGKVEGYLNDRGLRILGALDSVAKETNSTPAQVALAWLIHRPEITAPIASATTVEQLLELAGGARLNLNEVMMDILNRASEY